MYKFGKNSGPLFSYVDRRIPVLNTGNFAIPDMLNVWYQNQIFDTNTNNFKCIFVLLILSFKK